MMSLRFGITVIICISFLWGCEAFTARTPEPPDGSGGIFIPPTSPQIVIENFIASIADKNPDNYISCFAVAGIQTDRPLLFEPSAQARGRYAGFFDDWTLMRERQSFVSIIARIPTDRAPFLSLASPQFELLQPDSAIFVSDYRLVPQHTDTNVRAEFTGRMRLTISYTSGGLWEISSWADLAEDNNDQSDSWSILKAVFSN